MKIISFSLISVLLLAFTCESDVTDTLSNQDFIFIKIYENYAWGHDLDGWIIDNSGKINTFSLGKNPELDWTRFDKDEYICEEDLYNNYLQTNKTSIKIGLSEVYHHFLLIEDASKGVLSEKEAKGADMGMVSYYAFRYIPEEEKYKAIILYQNGDYELENLSRSAQKITQWLINLDKRINLSAES